MRNVLTVTQVNRYIKQLFQRDALLRTLIVKGEISNCTYHGSGHIYFTLKDAGATLSCVMFASDRKKLAFRLTPGVQVQVKGIIDVYERDGKYQLYAKEITADGAGALYEQFVRLKERLGEEGLFAEEYKRPIPSYARVIGVVTAPTGAAVRDIINISRRRNPYVQLVLYPAIVQGEAAAPDIVKGIQALERYGVDVIIAGRGGGSIEDLWAFNEEIVARAIFDCGVPVISAVGHETDVTISDFVADLRAPTPSAAAELAVFEYERFADDLGDSREALYALMRGRIDEAKATLLSYRKSLSYLSPQARVRDLRLRSASYAQRLCTLLDTRVTNDKSRIDPLKQALYTAMRARVTAAKHALVVRSERLNGLSPLTRLKAGYGYVTNGQGKRILSAAETQTGDRIGIFMTDGKIDATVNGRSEHDFMKGNGNHG